MAGTGREEEDTVAELFGDFDSDEEKAPAAAPAGGRLKRAAPSEEDLFGAPEGDEPAAKMAKTSKPRVRADISRFYDMEAAEGGGSGDEDDDDGLDDLFDDNDIGGGGSGDRAKLARAANMMGKEDEELRAVEKDMKTRRGAENMKGLLDRMEDRYKAMEEEEERDREQALQPGRERRPRASGDAASDAGSLALAPSIVGSELDVVEKTNSFIVPEPKDPKLWMVKTFGPEKDLTLALLLKFGEHLAKGETVPVFSIFYSPHLRGFVYVEAHKEAEIRSFIKGIRGISQWGIKLVPTAQMPEVFMSSMTDASNHEMLKVGDWVRMKRPEKYKGDLARIEEVRDEDYVVKVKPRLDLSGAIITKNDSKDNRKARRRAVARWFNKADCESAGLIVNVDRRFTSKGYFHFFMVDEDVYRDGFLVRTVKGSYLEKGELVKPLEHELQDWRFAPPPDDNNRPAEDREEGTSTPMGGHSMMLPPTMIPTKRVGIQDDDVVIVATGDLKNLRGVVTKSNEDAPTCMVKPFNVDGVKGELSFSVSVLSKYFEIGDHVKACAGEFEGDSGIVVKVILQSTGPQWGFNTWATILSDSLHAEFTSRVNHLRITPDVVSTIDMSGEFTVGQLVRLQGMVAGIIVRMEAGSRALVLTQDGHKHLTAFGEMEPADLDGGWKKKLWTTDRKKQKIVVGATVLAPRGATRAEPIRAEVLFIHQKFCFLMAKESLVGEKAYMVCPGNKCEYIWIKGAERYIKPKTEEESTQGTIHYGIQKASEVSFLRTEIKKFMGIEESNLQVKGAAVRINGGTYKGLRGEIRDYLGDKVLISLLCKAKLVKVDVSIVAPDDYAPTKRKTLREVAAPGTPKLPPLFVPGTPKSQTSAHPPVDGEDDDAADTAMPTEDDAWDPYFGVERPDMGPANTAKVASGKENQSTEDKSFGRRAADTPPGTPGLGDTQRKEAEGDHALRLKGTPPSQGTRSGTGTPNDNQSSEPPRGAAGPGGGVNSDGPRTVPPGKSAAVKGQQRKKKKSRFGLDLEHGFTSPSPGERTDYTGISSDRISTSGSISGLFQQGVDEVAREPWLMVGLGVRYTQDNKDCSGWIVKVYADVAHVVPESEKPRGDNVKNLLPLKGSAIRPWLCAKRNELAMVFDGPTRGQRGKTIGFDANRAYLQSEGAADKDGKPARRSLLGGGSSGGEAIMCEKKDVARFSVEWEKAAEKMRNQPLPAIEAMLANDPTTENDHPTSETEHHAATSDVGEDSTKDSNMNDGSRPGSRKAVSQAGSQADAEAVSLPIGDDLSVQGSGQSTGAGGTLAGMAQSSAASLSGALTARGVSDIPYGYAASTSNATSIGHTVVGQPQSGADMDAQSESNGSISELGAGEMSARRGGISVPSSGAHTVATLPSQDGTPYPTPEGTEVADSIPPATEAPSSPGMSLQMSGGVAMSLAAPSVTISANSLRPAPLSPGISVAPSLTVSGAPGDASGGRSDNEDIDDEL